MQDRVSLYPGRVKLEPVAGQANTYDLTRADQPTQEGTPLNKASLLSDATAAAIKALLASQTEDPATPNAALAILAQAVEDVATVAAGSCSMDTLTYTGTGKYGAENPTTITFPKMPVFFIVYGFAFFMAAEGQRTDSVSVSQSNASGLIGIDNYTLTWTGNTVKFYSSSGSIFQGNFSSKVYRVIAFYAQD